MEFNKIEKMFKYKFNLLPIVFLLLNIGDCASAKPIGSCRTFAIDNEMGFMCYEMPLQYLAEKLHQIEQKVRTFYFFLLFLFLKKLNKNFFFILIKERFIAKPIALRLSRINFHNSVYDFPTLYVNWFTSTISVKHLQLRDTYLWAIDEDAFNTQQFADLEILEIRNIRMSMLAEGVFNGLTNLKTLLLIQLEIKEFPLNLLEPVPNLEIFTLQFGRNETISVDAIFGCAKLAHLQKVNIRWCNLNHTITKKTFTGLSKVRQLMLEQNKIEFIGSQSFNVPLQTLTYLSLEGNRLKVLSPIFRTKRLKSLKFNIANNPWDCDCKQEQFLLFIQSIKDIKLSKEIECQSPPELFGRTLTLKICNIPTKLNDVPSKYRPIDGQMMKQPSIIGNKRPIEIPSNIIVMGCMVRSQRNPSRLEKGDILLTKPTFNPILSIRSINDTLLIDAKGVMEKVMLIIFEQNQLEEKIEPIQFIETTQCKTHVKQNGQNHAVEMKLKSDQIYRICTIGRGLIVRPFDCITIVSEEIIDKDVADIPVEIWIPTKDRSTLIVAFLLSLIFGSIIGLYISVALVKLFPKLVHGKIKIFKNTDDEKLVQKSSKKAK